MPSLSPSSRRAAEQGHDAAQWVLGTNYLFGSRSVSRDDVAAYMWLHLALSQNDKHDRTPLGRRRRPNDGWPASAGGPAGRDTLSPMDTHGP